jgi:hypothetical protein
MADATTTEIRSAPTATSTGTAVGPTLQQFAHAAAASEGMTLSELPALEQLEIRTRNTVYHLTVLGGTDTRVLVQGGRFFPVQSEVRLNGSTLGGSLLKVGWIGCGFCMEFMQGGQRVTTTRVREIRRAEHPVAEALH